MFFKRVEWYLIFKTTRKKEKREAQIVTTITRFLKYRCVCNSYLQGIRIIILTCNSSSIVTVTSYIRTIRLIKKEQTILKGIIISGHILNINQTFTYCYDNNIPSISSFIINQYRCNLWAYRKCVLA